MLFTTLLSVLLTLFSAHTVQAVPLPTGCTCGNSPLSKRTFNYIFQVTKARHLTPEECAFICNPSPQRQQQTVLSAALTDHKGLSASSANPDSSSIDNTSQAVYSRGSRLKDTTHSPATSLQADSSLTVEPPPISGTPTARPLPLLDVPPAVDRKGRYPSRPASVPNSRHAGKASHARAQSTMSPHRKALLPCASRLAGSLILLFVIAVCIVEIGDATVLFFRR